MHFMIKCNVNNVHMLTKEDTNQESAKSVANILEDALCGHFLLKQELSFLTFE